ncbi:hybrid sensor histidine kinase/response regulator [bacterium SCSIO 12741]|nr:hybrid sensor histidine kinase/response regulator [bacterium SCSIO 12741]
MPDIDLKFKRVIFIDDNPNNLTAFRALLRDRYEIYTSTDVSEALTLVKEKRPSVVVADYKMPELSGVEFLQMVKEIDPLAIRMMLTGHANLKAVVQAINQSEIFRFIVKPWSEEELTKALDNAIELYHTRYMLDQKNEELKKAFHEMDRLVFSTAHDITGPLSNILGLVNLIRIDKDRTDEYLDLINSMAKKMQLLAKDVLSFHRNKRTELNVSKTPLRRMVNSTIKDYAFLENAQRLNYEVEIDQDVDFYTDRTRLRFILNNLLSNAIKYQDLSKEENQVKIVGEVNENELTLKISDNGIGIEKETLPKIFDIYYRASDKSTGSGIGLYIVSEAVDFLGGKIDVESLPDSGTTFTVKLPNLAKLIAE